MVEVVEKLKHIVVEKRVHTMEVLASKRYLGDFSN